MGKIYSGEFRCLEIFLRCPEGEDGRLRLRQEGQDWMEYPAGRCQYRLRRIPLDAHTEYELELSHCQAGITYLSGSPNMMETGVLFLEFQGEEWAEIRDIRSWYDTSNREQYHFNAFKNWINDPNGLCYYKGFYHLYYQANPHEQQWGHMYWGHAASRDLVHWVHLPYALEPQEEILATEGRKGGAFSGCAVPLDDEIVFYLTRHFGPEEDTEEDTTQYQTMVTSKDGLSFGPEEIIIEKPDASFSYNFRDPKVTFTEGAWQMVLGTRVNNVPALIRYSSEDMKAWRYQGLLLKEKTQGVYTFECPDFFELDGAHVVSGSWMKYTDEQGRFQPTCYYIGKFQDGAFQVESKGLYDFGGNFYAVQSFEHDGRRLAIGWAADFFKEHRPEENGSCGAMTIPRELSVKNGRLYQRPAREIYSQTGRTICDVAGQELVLRCVNRNAYYARLDFNGNTEFDLVLGRCGEASLRLVREGKLLQIRTQGGPYPQRNLSAEAAEIKKLEIFVDRRLVEIFVNDGELAGTRLFYQDSGEGVFYASFQFKDRVDRIRISGMDGIWGCAPGERKTDEMRTLYYKHYPFEGITNFRDLGGYPVQGGGMTRYGAFFRCAHLGSATGKDLAVLRGLGVRKIVDLRYPEDLERVPDAVSEADGFTVINVSLMGDIGPGEIDVIATEKDTRTLRGMYKQIVDRSGSLIIQTLQELADAEGPVAFHCFNGKDRTGVIAMFLLSLAGVAQCDIVADYEVSHTYIEDHTDDVSGSHYENMKWLLSYLNEKFGSPIRYLRRQGLTPELERRLVERMT